MKKFIAMLLSLTLIFSLAACGGDDKAEVRDDSLTEVEVTMPADVYEDMTEEEILENASENGIEKCTVNEDGTVTYVVTKAKRQELLDEIEKAFDEAVEDTIGSEETPNSFVEITHSDNFDNITAIANESYTEWDGLLTLGLLVIGNYYQTFSGIPAEETNVTVIVSDEKSGKELQRLTSQDLRDLSSDMESE